MPWTDCFQLKLGLAAHVGPEGGPDETGRAGQCQRGSCWPVRTVKVSKSYWSEPAILNTRNGD